MAAFDEAADHAPQLSLSVGVLLAKDLHDEALRVAEEAQQSATDARAEAAAWRAICKVRCFMAEQPQSEHIIAEAAKIAKAAVAASERANDSLGKAAGLNALAQAYLAATDEQQALRAAGEALAAFRAQANQAGEASVLCTLARIYSFAGKNQKAFELVTDALSIFRTINEKRGMAMALHILAETHFSMKKISDALQVAERMCDHFQEIDDPLGQGIAKLLSAKLHQAIKDNNVVVSIALEASQFFKKAKAVKKLAVTCQLGAEAAIAERQGDEALELVGRSLAYFEQAGDKLGQAGARMTMAKLYLGLGEFDKAAYRAETASQTYQKLGYVDQAASALRASCQALLDKRLLDPKANVAKEVMRTANASLQLYEEAGMTGSSEYGLSLNALAQAQLAADDFGRAAELAEEAQALLKKTGHFIGVATTLNTLAQVHHKQGESFDAVSEAREALQLFQEHDDNHGAAISAYLIDAFQAPPPEQSSTDQPDGQTRQSDVPSESGLEDMIPGGWGGVTPLISFTAFESRSAGGQVQKKTAAPANEGSAPSTREEALFSVRWISASKYMLSANLPEDENDSTRVLRRDMLCSGGEVPAGIVPFARRYMMKNELPIY